MTTPHNVSEETARLLYVLNPTTDIMAGVFQPAKVARMKQAQFNPFHWVPAPEAPLSLSVVHRELGKVVNKDYMPSATSTRSSNTKPEYTRFACEDFPEFPRVLHTDATDFYAFDAFEVAGASAGVFAMVAVRGFNILVNLQTLDTLVKVGMPHQKWFRWTGGDVLQRVTQLHFTTELEKL